MASFAFAMTVLAALFTSFYSWRLVFMTFHGKPRASASVMSHVHESPKIMTVPLFILSVGALFAGVAFYGHFIGHEYDHFWKGALFTGPTNNIIHEFHHVPFLVKAAATIVMILGFVIAYVFYCLLYTSPSPRDRG